MVFNFKNNKITIILLLILLFISVFCYQSIKNNVDETFSNMDYIICLFQANYVFP